jgi:hypothetical protein
MSAIGSRFTLIALLVFPVALLQAHHSAAAEFDNSKPVVLRGKVTKVEWMNPHVFIWVDVADASGSVTNWQVESVAPNYLQRLGWNKQSLKAGDTVTIRAFMAKDQAHLAKTDAVDLPDGRRITTGRAEDGARDVRSR